VKCGGLHCNGCSGGGGGALAVVVVLIAIAAIGKTVSKAVAEAFHVLAVVLEVFLITAASLAGIAILAGLGWAALRIRRAYATRAAAAGSQPACQAIPVQSEPLAIEPPRVRTDPVADLLPVNAPAERR
jgi:hypothetical protein